MKKLIYLFTLMTLVAFTSCNNSSEDEAVQSFSGTIISRAINGNEVVFSQGNTQCTVNLTKRTVQFSSDFKDADGHVQSLNSPVMDFVFKTSNILSFNGDGTSGEINDLNGYLDLGTGMFWYTLSLSDGTLVVSSTHPLYAYAKRIRLTSSFLTTRVRPARCTSVTSSPTPAVRFKPVSLCTKASR